MAGNEDTPRNNGAVLNMSQVIKAVMSSADEAKLGALFINAKQQYQFEQHLLRWDMPNQKHQCKQTIPQNTV